MKGVYSLLLLLMLLLLQLLFETEDSLPTKNFVKLRSNDVGTMAGDTGSFQRPKRGGVNCKSRD